MRPTLTADSGSTSDATEPTTPSVLCIDGDRSFTLKIPPSGELVIGRGPEAGFSVEDPQVSRAHAQLLLAPDGLRISDLGSRHGTFVNGDRLHEPRVLRAGDVVSLGATLLVARRSPSRATRSVVEHAPFVRRLADEVARCVAFERELSIVVVRDPRGGDVTATIAALGDRLRTIDTVAPIGPRHAGILMPELDAEELAEVLARLSSLGLAIGATTAPHGGIDADGLLAGARAACDAATAGSPLDARDAAETLVMGSHRIVVADPSMAKLYELARRVARSTIPVLIQGETGVGKELAAATVHACSPRAHGPFVSVNCAAIPETLAESELFGHVKGAFSGAVQNKVGYIEASAGGTLFLDEIGELSAILQAKLLRVLESGELIRVGEVKPRALDLRIVAATNRDLQKEIEDGRFRSDLYFRLGAARLEIPPLRERPRDLAILATTLLRDACRRMGRSPLTLSTPAAIALFGHEWPGNIRELRHAIEYAAAAAPDQATELEIWHLPQPLAAEARRHRDGTPVPTSAPAVTPASDAIPTTFRPIADEVRELERARMIAALRATGGVQNRAAELIEMPLRTFVTKLKRYAITPEELRG